SGCPDSRNHSISTYCPPISRAISASGYTVVTTLRFSTSEFCDDWRGESSQPAHGSENMSATMAREHFRAGRGVADMKRPLAIRIGPIVFPDQCSLARDLQFAAPRGQCYIQVAANHVPNLKHV